MRIPEITHSVSFAMRRPGVRIPLPRAFAFGAEHKKRRLPRLANVGEAAFELRLGAPKRLRLREPAFFPDPAAGKMDLMNSFYYVYILVSETNEKAHYSGVTPDIDARLNEHNRGKCPHTSKNRPWKIETTDRDFARPALAGFRDWGIRCS
jgi:GIY-YIG catalytic domain